MVMITEELLEWKSSGSASRKPRLTAVGIRCADTRLPLSTNFALTSPTSGGRSAGVGYEYIDINYRTRESQHRSVSVATRPQAGETGTCGWFPAGPQVFLFITTSRPILGPTHTPYPTGSRGYFLAGEIGQGVEIIFIYRQPMPGLPYVFTAWCLNKHKDNFNTYICLTFLPL
jgi:hypothetical protein